MSFDLLKQTRRVGVINTTRPTRDDYGNQVTAEAPPVFVSATRQQLSAEEDTTDRDQQARSFRYFFDANVQIDGRSILTDDADRLKIIGEPEHVGRGILGSHHIEALATLIEG